METENIKKVSVSAKGKPTIVVGQFKQFGDKDVWVVSTEKIDVEVSDSFQNSLKLLLPHFLLLNKIGTVKIDTEYIDKQKVLKDAKLKDYSITGFDLSGEGDDEKVVLHGKIWTEDKAVSVPTLSTKFYNNDEYPFSGNLKRDIESVLEEVLSLFNGNFKTDPQGQIEYPELDGEETEEDEKF